MIVCPFWNSGVVSMKKEMTDKKNDNVISEKVKLALLINSNAIENYDNC